MTATALLALSAALAPEPLAARSRHHGHAVVPIETKKLQAAASAIPLPQPRPAEAPPRASDMARGKDAPANDHGKDDGKDSTKPEAAAPEPQPPSACRLALTDQIAIAPSIPAIHGPGACGGDDLVRLEAVVLPDKTRVALTPAGIMRCTMAAALANWVRDDVAPEVAKLGSAIKTLDNYDSYECRGRNGVAGAHLSEHGKANAIDVHGFKLADGRMIELTDRTQPRAFRETILHSACTRFPTVLGPGSDGYHEDHIHVDLIERRSNYRICQWDVLDPLPKVAPLLPQERPADAPPRDVAQADQGKGKADAKGGNATAGSSEAGEPDKSVNATDAGGGKADGHAKQEAKPAPDKSATGPEPAPPEPASSAASTVKTPAETPAKPDNKSGVASKPAATSPDKLSAAKPAEQTSSGKAGKRTSEKSSSEQATSEKPASDKPASEKAPRKKVAADKPRRHHHRARIWNPFASFF